MVYLEALNNTLFMRDNRPALLRLYMLWLACRDPDRRRSLYDEVKKAAHWHMLNVWQLGDRIVPEVDLQGRVFDYGGTGGRHFTLELGADLTPRLRDGKGRLWRSLPARTLQDDESRTISAMTDWRDCKQLLADTRYVQRRLFRRAMIHERRWTSSDFKRLFLEHPLLRHLTTMLVWGVYESSERGAAPLATFRPMPDLTLADVHDQPYVLPQEAFVGLVHPVYLSEELRAGWIRQFHDYEIIQPFAQIDRTVYTPMPHEIEDGILRFRTYVPEEKERLRFKGSPTIGLTEFNRMRWRRSSSSIYVRNCPGTPIVMQILIHHGGNGIIPDAVWFTIKGHLLSFEAMPPILFSETIRELKQVLRYKP